MYIISKVSGLFFLLFPVLLVADDFSNAINAMQNENYQYSSIVWNRLSKQGNILADYNMAINLKKMNARSEDQKEWLRTAARKRLVTAYGMLQPGSIKPAKYQASSNSIYVKPDDWVKIQKPGYYTLQLASSIHEKSIDKIYEQYQMKGQGSYFKNVKQGQARFTLVYGAYPTASDARIAIDDLPEGLRKWKPWVRNIKSIQKIMKPLE